MEWNSARGVVISGLDDGNARMLSMLWYAILMLCTGGWDEQVSISGTVAQAKEDVRKDSGLLAISQWLPALRPVTIHHA